MNKKVLIIFCIVVAVILAGLLRFHFNKAEKAYDMQRPSVTEELRMYTNDKFGYVFTYPAKWVNHPSPWSVPPAPTEMIPNPQADRIIIGPETLPLSCRISAPPTPATPLDITHEDQSLEATRAGYRRQVGGADYVESTTTIGNLPAFVYASASDADGVCPDGIARQPFRIFVVAHGDTVISISTGLYQDEDIQNAIDSFRFK